jgi:hypothetical protein
VSASGRYVAYFDIGHGMHVYDRVTTNVTNWGNGEESVIGGMTWSPVADRLVYLDDGVCTFDPMSYCISAFEWDAATAAITTLAEAEYLDEPSYKPDGTAIAYRCSGAGCCDPTPGEYPLCTSNGLAVPHPAGMIDETAIWSPDGTAIAFVRTDPGTDNLGTLMIWHPGDPAATALTGPVLGLRDYPFLGHKASWTRVPQ